jgi:hypothetical protein
LLKAAHSSGFFFIYKNVLDFAKDKAPERKVLFTFYIQQDERISVSFHTLLLIISKPIFMRNSMFLILLFSVITFSSFQDKLSYRKTFCGAGINIINNTLGRTITKVSVQDPFVTDTRTVSIGPGQSLYLGQYGGPSFHVKLFLDTLWTGSVSVTSGTEFVLCQSDDNFINLSFTATHCGTYDVAVQDAPCDGN